MNATNHETHELTLQELEIVAGGGLATPKGSIIIFGYGIQWNDRSICIVRCQVFSSAATAIASANLSNRISPSCASAP